jgi:hypothetical protein
MIDLDRESLRTLLEIKPHRADDGWFQSRANRQRLPNRSRWPDIDASRYVDDGARPVDERR